MAKQIRSTVAERLYWCYSTLAMAEMAVHDRCERYDRRHYMVRARLYKGLRTGTMSPRSLMRDQAIRLRLPQECVYCGSTNHLSIDHVVPVTRGGDDRGDNAVWACRRCNSSKAGRDLFEWWASARGGLPPLFAIRVYLKQAIIHFDACGLMASDWSTTDPLPFSLRSLPESFPPPTELQFTPFHHRSSS